MPYSSSSTALPPTLSAATSSPECVGAQPHQDPGTPPCSQHVSTPYIEQQNLTVRMGMRRFTRLTIGFSKKAENLAAALSLHFMHYNFAQPHKSPANPYPRTPTMAAEVTDHVWSVDEMVGLLG